MVPAPAKGKKRLVLLDSHAILHRAYHALPDFSTEKGEPTGALYGLASMLMRIIQDLKPHYLVAAYDLPGGTFRHEAYEAYKAKRPKMEDSLASQIERSRDIYKAFGIPVYEYKGFEADDILGTIVEQTRKKKDLDIIIASGDMDTLQLVEGTRVRVYTLRKGLTDTVLYDEAKVEERFGFPATLLPDYKGLRGDPSDNIVGVPGIGEKTATTLIKEFGSVKDIYKALKKDEKRFEKAGLSERIVTLLKEHEEEAEFSTMLATIRRDAPIHFELPGDFRATLNLEKLIELFQELEFRTLSARAKSLFGGSTAPVEEEKERQESVDPAELKRAALALWLLHSDTTNPTLDDVLHYAKTKKFEDAKKKIFAELRGTPMERVYRDIEEPLIPVLERMERRGVLIDRDYLEKLSKGYHRKLDATQENITKLAGEEFNVSSPKQLAHILFEKLALTGATKRTATGQRSTKESELEKLRDAHPIIPEILAYRELSKLLGTYIDAIPPLLDKGNRLHTTFIQTGASTGRMASQNPNLQNIPLHSEQGRAIRHAFVADSGFELLTLDYSQIELRLAAILSEDETLLEIFRSGGDVHAAVASHVFGVPSERVDSEMRRVAKIINFGILYGMGVNSLRTQLGTTTAEARRFYDEYFKRFQGLAHYLERVKGSAAKKGYTETMFGRRRFFAGLRSPLPYVRAAAERMAINAPMQGTQSDIIKLAMVRIDSLIRERGWERDVYMLLQIHDELIFEVKTGLMEEAARAIRDVMQGIMTLKETHGVPLTVAAHRGKNWGETTTLTL